MLRGSNQPSPNTFSTKHWPQKGCPPFFEMPNVLFFFFLPLFLKSLNALVLRSFYFTFNIVAHVRALLEFVLFILNTWSLSWSCSVLSLQNCCFSLDCCRILYFRSQNFPSHHAFVAFVLFSTPAPRNALVKFDIFRTFLDTMLLVILFFSELLLLTILLLNLIFS